MTNQGYAISDVFSLHFSSLICRHCPWRYWFAGTTSSQCRWNIIREYPQQTQLNCRLNNIGEHMEPVRTEINIQSKIVYHYGSGVRNRLPVMTSNFTHYTKLTIRYRNYKFPKIVHTQVTLYLLTLSAMFNN